MSVYDGSKFVFCLFVFSSFDNSFVFVLFALLLFFLSSYYFFFWTFMELDKHSYYKCKLLKKVQNIQN